MAAPLGAAAGCSGTGSAARSASVVPDAASAPQAVLLVGNVGDGTISLIDTGTLAVIGTLDVIPDGATPRDPSQAAAYGAIVMAKGVNYVQGIAVSPDARTLYVSRGYLGDVAAFDLASKRLLWRLQARGLRADHVALSPDGRRLFVSAITADAVQVIDTASGTFTGALPVATYPHVLRFTPDEKFLVVGSLGNTSAAAGHQGEQSLTFVDPGTLRIDRTLRFDAGVRPFVFSPEGDRVYLQLSFFNGLLVADARSGQILKKVDLPVTGAADALAPRDYPNQAAHHGLALSADGTTLCDAATVSGYVALLDRESLAVQAIVQVGDQPADAETSLDGKYCFVSNRGPSSNAVSVISYGERREVARIPVGLRPQELVQARLPPDVVAAIAPR